MWIISLACTVPGRCSPKVTDVTDHVRVRDGKALLQIAAPHVGTFLLGTPGITTVCFSAGGRANHRASQRHSNCLFIYVQHTCSSAKVIHRGTHRDLLDSARSDAVTMFYHHKITDPNCGVLWITVKF